MLGDKKKPKPAGRYCAYKKCRGWYRPSKYRSAGKDLEYCSTHCLRRVQEESENPAAGESGPHSW